MGKNIGYLTSSHSPESDKCYTPEYVVDAIATYLPPMTSPVLCPFSKDEDAFPKVLRKKGFKVHNTHYDPETGEGFDFFNYTAEMLEELNVFHIIDNPPFSLKDDILSHCESISKAYALLLPLPTLQSIKRFKEVFSKGKTELLLFDKRIPYSTDNRHWSEQSGNHFASIFICKNMLPYPLIWDELNEREDEK